MVDSFGNRILCCLLYVSTLAIFLNGQTQARDFSTQVLQVAQLEQKKGHVTIKYSGAEQSEAVPAASPIHHGDTLETGAGSQAWFRWYGPQENENCLGQSRFECDVFVGQRSRVRIASSHQHRPAPAFSCSVDYGIVRFREKIPRINDVCSRLVVTPMAQIEVVASESAIDFAVEVQQNPTLRTVVSVVSGKVKVRGLSEDMAQEKVLQSNEALTLAKDTKHFAVREISGETLGRLIELVTVYSMEAEKIQAERKMAEMREKEKTIEAERSVAAARRQAKTLGKAGHGLAKMSRAPTQFPQSMSKTSKTESSAQRMASAKSHLGFPWPPPRASVVEVVPRDLLELKHGDTLLKDVDRRLSEALSASGYFDSRYYDVPGGFALVTRMEQIESDGSPKPGSERWALNISAANFSLEAYLKALFRGRPGYYRIIAFIVCPHDVEQSDATITERWAKEWLKRGLNRLPQVLGDLKFSQSDYACTALIYEFERVQEASRIEVRCPGQIAGRDHLVKAGIWESLQARSR